MAGPAARARPNPTRATPRAAMAGARVDPHGSIKAHRIIRRQQMAVKIQLRHRITRAGLQLQVQADRRVQRQRRAFQHDARGSPATAALASTRKPDPSCLVAARSRASSDRGQAVGSAPFATSAPSTTSNRCSPARSLSPSPCSRAAARSAGDPASCTWGRISCTRLGSRRPASSAKGATSTSMRSASNRVPGPTQMRSPSTTTIDADPRQRQQLEPDRTLHLQVRHAGALRAQPRQLAAKGRLVDQPRPDHQERRPRQRGPSP